MTAIFAIMATITSFIDRAQILKKTVYDALSGGNVLKKEQTTTIRDAVDQLVKMLEDSISDAIGIQSMRDSISTLCKEVRDVKELVINHTTPQPNSLVPTQAPATIQRKRRHKRNTKKTPVPVPTPMAPKEPPTITAKRTPAPKIAETDTPSTPKKLYSEVTRKNVRSSNSKVPNGKSDIPAKGNDHKIIRGSGAPDKQLQSANIKKHIHVFYLHPSTTEHAVKDYINRKLPLCSASAVKIATRSKSYSSFRVQVPSEYADQLLEPKLWPSGTAVNRWKFR